MTKVLKLVLPVLAVLLTSLTVIGAFLNGYEPDTIFSHPASSMENFLMTATWICAALATVVLFLSYELSNPAKADVGAGRLSTEHYLYGDRADAKAAQHFPHLIIWLAPALLSSAWGLGILMSPAETDLFNGWVYLVAGIATIVVTSVVQAHQRRRRHQLYAITANGIDTTGVIREHKAYYNDDNSKTKVLVAFTDTHGGNRTALAVLTGDVPVGTKLKVRYLPDAPHIKPAITKTDGANIRQMF